MLPLWGCSSARVGGRQEEHLAASPLYNLAHLLALVGRQVVHHHHLPRPQGGCQDPLYVRLKHRLVRPALHRQGRPHALRTHARQERLVLPAVARRPKACPLASRGQPCRGASEVLAPISSTNTKRPASRASATSTRQAALSHSSSRSLAPKVLFSGKSHPPQQP